MSEERCRTCRFFEAGRGYVRAPGSDFIEMDRPIHGYAQKRVKGPVEGGDQIGPCRRYPPQPQVLSWLPGRQYDLAYYFWPEVIAESWCGEWQERKPQA
jgi:hypothetical protein